MPSIHDPLQFYATMNPKPGNGVPQKVLHSVSKRYSSSADCLPGKLNFYSSMSSSAANSTPGANPSPNHQTTVQQPSASSGPVYTVRCETSATQQGKTAAGQEFRIARKQELVPPEFGGSIIWDYIHADHLGSVRMLTLPQKNLPKAKTVQYIEYDSFGNVIDCANPGFRFPLGFAGGLNDLFTAFVRFGSRRKYPPYLLQQVLKSGIFRQKHP